MRSTPWVDEFRRQLAKSYGVTSIRPNIAFTSFDELDGRLAEAGLSRARVLDQVRAGIFQLDRTGGSNSRRPQYRMVTEELELLLHAEPWMQDPRQLLVVLDRAKPRNGFPLSEWLLPVVPAWVAEFPSREGRTFDIDLLIVEMGRRRDVVEAGRTLTKIRLDPRTGAALRAEVSKRYGSLRALLELVKRRAELSDEVRGSGTVLEGSALFGPDDARARHLVVRVHGEVRFSEEEGNKVAVRVDDEDETRFDVVEYTDGVLVLAPKGQQVLMPGTVVRVREIERYRYKRHAFALRKFFERDITGNWTSLATLLCRPDHLAPPLSLPDLGHTVRELNCKQRTAVVGALAAPHAYFVQGPPGTGKTQVITELVSRLAARGERILLTAPTHVAVDEVLSRLDNEPGVLPIRLSYSDAKVDPAARKFTQRGYQSELAREVRLPANSGQPHRLERVAEIASHLAVLIDWQSAWTADDTAQATLGSARTAATHRHEHRTRAYAEEMARLAESDAAMTAQGRALAAVNAAASDLDQHITRLASARGVMRRMADALGFGALARARSRRRRIETDRIQIGNRYLEMVSHYDAWRSHADQVRVELNRQAEQDRRELADLDRNATLTAAERNTCRGRLREHGLDLFADDPARTPAQIRVLEAERTTLLGHIEVQQRWFELCGTDGRDEQTDRTKAIETVSKALSSAINLVCSTTTGIGGTPGYQDLDYDTLIVDEASKVTTAEFLIPAIRARRWILVGDERQLPPYVESRDEHHIHAMAAIHSARGVPDHVKAEVDKLADLWKATEDAEQHPFRVKSVRERAVELLDSGSWERDHRAVFADQLIHITTDKEPERELLRVMDDHLVRSLFEQSVTGIRKIDNGLCMRLTEQRRMPRQIAELVRVPVYHDQYTTPDDDRIPKPLLLHPVFPTPVVFLDTSAQPDPWDKEAGTSFVNHLEAGWAVDVCHQWERNLDGRATDGRTSISVVSFYAEQARLIRERLGAPRYRRFTKLEFKVVDSIDRIQGQQSDIVVVTFCRTYGKPKEGKLNGNERRPTGQPRPPTEGYARWLQNLNRLNVACTRARMSLILIGHGHTLSGLHGVSGGEAFYDNLFRLPRDVLTTRLDWVPTRGRRRR